MNNSMISPRSMNNSLILLLLKKMIRWIENKLPVKITRTRVPGKTAMIASPWIRLPVINTMTWVTWKIAWIALPWMSLKFKNLLFQIKAILSTLITLFGKSKKMSLNLINKIWPMSWIKSIPLLLMVRITLKMITTIPFQMRILRILRLEEI